MKIQKTNFPSILLDNEEMYLRLLEALINGHDLHASTEVTNKPTGYLVRIAPSAPQYLPILLEDIKIFHSSIGVTLEFSKSIKTATTLTFVISNNK